MRKQLKSKKRSCGLCKPHKRAWDNRWKPKDRQAIKQSEQEISHALRPPKTLSRQAIRRSVASSTAIETGQSIAELERQLQNKSGRFRNLKLAKR